ncbi:YidH family protein [Agromyces sp. NPDC057865]|uniref:YidH family protein n=1 Tax=Agromyces sp. NPDC057865 TaxID=3346267 RepID=UPI00366B2735
MRGPAWQHEGDDPDYRFTLANERTFLAWIRTALALLAGGVLLHQFAATLEPRVVLVSVSVALGLIASVLSVVSYTRWRANEIAIRRRRPLPYSWVLPALAGACLLTAAVLTFLLLVS